MKAPHRRRLLAAALAGPVAAAAPRGETVPLFIGEHSAHRVWLALFELLGRAAELRWALRPTPWPRAQLLTERGEGLMFGLRRSAERERRFYFSREVLSVHSWLVLRQGRSLERAAALSGRAVCAGRGSSYDQALREQGIDGVRWLESDHGDPGALRMLRAGRCDAALLTGPGQDAAAASALLQESGLKLDGLALRREPLLGTPLHFVSGAQGQWRWALHRLDEVIPAQRAAIDALLRLNAKP